MTFQAFRALDAFRHITPAHEVAPRSIQHNGWYTCHDTYNTERVCYGVVAQLPAKKGQVRFVAGWQFGDDYSGAVNFDLSEVYTSPHGGYHEETTDAAIEAARAADRLAEIAAEEERDYSAAYDAGRCYAENLDQEADLRREILDILAERRQARQDPQKYPALCAAIRDTVSNNLYALSKLREERKELADGSRENFWFNTYDAALRAAFCDAAGLDAFPG